MWGFRLLTLVASMTLVVGCAILVSENEDCDDNNRFSAGGLDCDGLENCGDTKSLLSQGSAGENRSIVTNLDVFAQQFTPDEAAKIRHIDIYAKKDNANDEFDSVEMNIYADCGDLPCDDSLGTATQAGSGLETTIKTFEMSFKPPVYVEGGAKYWFTVTFNDAIHINESASLSLSGSDLYSGGRFVISYTDGVTWDEPLNRDVQFNMKVCDGG